MSVISIRLPSEDLAWLKKNKVKPSTFAREAVHEAIRRAEMKRNRAWLEAHLIKLDRPSEEIIREERDALARRR